MKKKKEKRDKIRKVLKEMSLEDSRRLEFLLLLNEMNSKRPQDKNKTLIKK